MTHPQESKRQYCEKVYRDHRQGILAYAYCLLPDRQAAEDLVQTVFVEFYKQVLQTAKIDNPKTYLYRSIHNRALNSYQERKFVHVDGAGIRNIPERKRRFIFLETAEGFCGHTQKYSTAGHQHSTGTWNLPE